MEKRIYGLIKVSVLCMIISLGIALRSFNLNFPSIGYHNMNENEYLTTAQEMKKTHDYTLNKLYCYNMFEEPQDRHHPGPPLISYQILLAWKMLDENLWATRLFNMLFGASSILVIYFIASILFKNPILSLASSLLLAIMPLAVFFSRNLQPESPAFFFMALANLFYLRFVSSFKKSNLFFGGLALSAACIYRFNFFIGVIPFILCLPFQRFLNNRRKLLKTIVIFFLSLLPLITAVILLRYFKRWDFREFHAIRPFNIFTAGYWAQHGRMVWWYAKQENFTPIYTVLALSGIIAAFFKRKGLVNRYIIGWALALVIYAIVYSEYIYQNNFSQMPFLIFASISAVYAVFSISNPINKIFTGSPFIPLMLIAVIISAPFCYNSILGMYGTVFLGVDVAGESLREFSKPDEYIFLSSHIQGYGIVRYSQRSAGWVEDAGNFKKKEEAFRIKYACFYPPENLFQLKSSNPQLFEYIQKNYHIKEAGLTEEPARLYYFILERGEGEDLEKALGTFSGAKQIRAIYKLLDRYIFFYSLRPVKARPPGSE